MRTFHVLLAALAACTPDEPKTAGCLTSTCAEAALAEYLGSRGDTSAGALSRHHAAAASLQLAAPAVAPLIVQRSRAATSLHERLELLTAARLAPSDALLPELERLLAAPADTTSPEDDLTLRVLALDLVTELARTRPKSGRPALEHLARTSTGAFQRLAAARLATLKKSAPSDPPSPGTDPR